MLLKKVGLALIKAAGVNQIPTKILEAADVLAYPLAKIIKFVGKAICIYRGM